MNRSAFCLHNIASRGPVGSATDGRSQTGTNMLETYSRQRRCWDICAAGQVARTSTASQRRSNGRATVRPRPFGICERQLISATSWPGETQDLIHVLPSGFHRIRHYGLFASASRVEASPAPVNCSPHRCSHANRTRTPETTASQRRSRTHVPAAAAA